ncbi:hypothetical protein FJZ18_04090 [Candidatus Pacearchaeota archaeon]|nr:hypothetical protein [Candidatus Pacearchaeota archaeon]
MSYISIGFAILIWGAIGAAFLYKWRSTPKYIGEELLLPRKKSSETFSKGVKVLYRLYIAASLVLPIFLTLYLPNKIEDLQKLIYSSPQTLQIISADTQGLSMLFLLFITLAICTLPLYGLCSLYPQLYRFALIYNALRWKKYNPRIKYQEKINKKEQKDFFQEYTTSYDLKKVASNEWRSCYAASFWIWFILGFLLVLTFDNYTRISEEGISYNSFLSFQENNYTWKEVKNASIFMETTMREGKLQITPFFSISTHDKTFYIWKGFTGFRLRNPSPDTLEQIVMQLYSHNVTIYLTPMTEQQMRLLQEKMNKESQELGKRMFIDIQEKINFQNEQERRE